MFLYILSVECIYLFHRYTKKFIGEDPVNRPAPVIPAKAIDFQLIRGNNTIPYLTFQKNNIKSFDVRYGVQGTLLDYFSTHKGKNQSFLLVLRPDDTYSLVQSEKCINWDEDKNNQFIKEPCNDSNLGNIDVFYEISGREMNSKNRNDLVDTVNNKNDVNKEFIALTDTPDNLSSSILVADTPKVYSKSGDLQLVGVKKTYSLESNRLRGNNGKAKVLAYREGRNKRSVMNQRGRPKKVCKLIDQSEISDTEFGNEIHAALVEVSNSKK